MLKILIAGQFYDGLFLKDYFRVLCAEKKTGSVIEVQPETDNFNYYVVSNIKGVDGPNESLRTNKDESLVLANLGKAITIKQVLPNAGLKDTNIFIRTETQTPGCMIEDFVALRRTGVITANSMGILEVFSFDLKTKNYRKLSHVDLNHKITQPEQHQQITTMALSENEEYLAVSTITEDDSFQCRLKKLLIFKVRKDGKLQLIDQKEFFKSGKDSMYHYMNFEFSFKGVPLLLAFQSEDERRLDVYAFKNTKLSLVHSEKYYHPDDFSAIRSVNGSIVSMDYNGVLRVLNVPE